MSHRDNEVEASSHVEVLLGAGAVYAAYANNFNTIYVVLAILVLAMNIASCVLITNAISSDVHTSASLENSAMLLTLCISASALVVCLLLAQIPTRVAQCRVLSEICSIQPHANGRYLLRSAITQRATRFSLCGLPNPLSGLVTQPRVGPDRDTGPVLV